MPETLRLAVAEWTADLPAYPGKGAQTVKNVVPRTTISYGPVPSPQPIYNALGSRCRGATAYRDKDGTVYCFAGDATDLWLLTRANHTWTNASKAAGGYGASDQVWRWTYFNGDILATNYTDAIQKFTLGSSSNFGDLSADAPKAKYIAVVKNAFVVVGHTWDTTNGEKPQRIWWSAAGNHTNWPLVGSNAAAEVQSGAVDLLGPAGNVMGIAPDLIYAEAVVFQEYAVRRMTYTGPPTVWTMLPIESARGCVAPDSIATLGGIAYYWGQGGVVAFDGQQSVGIGAGRIDATVYGEVDWINIHRVVGVADSRNELVVWAYPTTQATDGNPDRLLFYHPRFDRFTYAEVTSETLVRLLSFDYTLAELETVLGYATVDALPYPVGSDAWLNGRVHLATFDIDHTMNFLSGPNLPAVVDLPEMQPVAGKRSFVRTARPLVSASDLSPSVLIGHRERVADLVTWTAPVTLNSMGNCPVRTSGRYIRPRITFPDGADWFEISGIELDADPQGTR